MIEILSYTPVNQGKKIGYVEVYIPKLGLIYRHLAHLQSGNKRWINFPTYSEEAHDKKTFHPYVEFQQQAHNSDFLDKVNDAVKEFCEKHKITHPDPLDLSGSMEGCPF